MALVVMPIYTAVGFRGRHGFVLDNGYRFVRLDFGLLRVLRSAGYVAFGALVCRRWASKRGLAGGRYAWTGGWYWIAGFAPWFYCLYQVNGRPPPIRMYNLAFRWLLVAWLVGPVIGGGMMAAGPGIGPNSGWLFAVPVVNLIGIVVLVIRRSVSTGTVTGDVQLRSGDVMPFFSPPSVCLRCCCKGFSHL